MVSADGDAGRYFGIGWNLPRDIRAEISNARRFLPSAPASAPYGWDSKNGLHSPPRCEGGMVHASPSTRCESRTGIENPRPAGRTSRVRGPDGVLDSGERRGLLSDDANGMGP